MMSRLFPEQRAGRGGAIERSGRPHHPLFAGGRIETLAGAKTREVKTVAGGQWKTLNCLIEPYETNLFKTIVALLFALATGWNAAAQNADTSTICRMAHPAVVADRTR